MKTTVILGWILFSIGASTAGAQRLTTADPNFTELSQLANSIGWYQVSGTKAWSVGDADADQQGADRMATLDKLRSAAFPTPGRWRLPMRPPTSNGRARIHWRKSACPASTWRESARSKPSRSGPCWRCRPEPTCDPATTTTSSVFRPTTRSSRPVFHPRNACLRPGNRRRAMVGIDRGTAQALVRCRHDRGGR